MSSSIGTRVRSSPLQLQDVHPEPVTDENDDKNIWLFDLQSDPLEAVDVSGTHTDLVKMLLDKLAAYNKTAVPVQFPPYDPNSAPDKHNGVWMPWL